MLKRLVFLIALVALIGIVTGCAWLGDLLNSASATSEKYLFIETWTQWQVEVVKGSFGLMIDFPTYSYNVEQQTLDLSVPGDPRLATNHSFLALWGDGTSLQVKNGEGGGISSAIAGIYQLPFEQQARDFALRSIDPNGTVSVLFHDTEHTLKPGESWQTTTEPSVETVDSNVLKESYTYIIRNFGWWPKQKLHLPRS